MSVDEIAELLGLAKGTVYHLVSEERIPCVRLSARCLRFRLSEVMEWIEKKSIKGA
jgi:excisionase family DNA binding protein